MQVKVTGKQLDVGDNLREHVEHRLKDAVGKYFDHAIEASVVVSRDAQQLRADISVHVGRGILVQGHGRSDSAYGAFDVASDRIAKQLRRYKRRLRDHHRKEKSAKAENPMLMQQYILSGADTISDSRTDPDEVDPPVIIAEMTTEIDFLSVEEAVMRMELADQAALVFRNAGHGGLNVVYRRSDGNLGWIDPAGNTEIRDKS